MTTKEFSEQFDTMLDSYKLKNGYGTDENLYTLKLDEYEKSVYLTQAQNDMIIELYTGRGQMQSAYEETEELRRYLANLNETIPKQTFSSLSGSGIAPNSVTCAIGDNVLYITQEQCQVESLDPCINNSWIDTIPIRRDDYNRMKNNPFKNKKIWRIDRGAGVVELISPYTLKVYKVTFLRRPGPIILEDLNYLTINGISTKSECELNPILHKYVLERAVQSAYSYMATKFDNKEDK